MTREQAEQNVRLYYFYQLFSMPLFWGPTLILFIKKMGKMTLSEIFFMEAISVLGIVFLEVPSGAVADIIGRKKTILIGSCIYVIDGVLFSLAASPAMIWVANAVWVVGFSLISGADSSLLFDTLKFLGREKDFKKIHGRASAGQLTAAAIASLVAGYLANIYLRLPMFFSLPGLVAGCFVVARFFEPPMLGDVKLSRRSHWNLMKVSVLFVANHKRVKWVILYVALIGSVSKVWFFTYNPYFELVGLSLPGFGWVFCILGLIAATSSYFSDWLAKRLGDLGSVILMLALVAIPIMVMSTVLVKPMVLLVLFQNVTRGYIGPFTSHFLHSHLDSKNRATVVSIQSAVGSLCKSIMLALGGCFLCFGSVVAYLQVLGFFTLAAGAIIVIFYMEIFNRD